MICNARVGKNYKWPPSILLTLFQDNISAFFGGYAVYYLGIYSYGTNVSRPKDRAYRLARLDGVETVALVVGTLISPKVKKPQLLMLNISLVCHIIYL